MWKLIIITSILSVICQDVYRFNRPVKDVEEFIYCDKDKTYKCSVSETCCPTGLNDPNKFRCCDLDKATCCKNGNSCCPESYMCSNSTGLCYPSLLTIFVQRKVALLHSHNTRIVRNYQEIRNLKPPSFQQIISSDSDSQCGDANTRCPLTNGEYGCCPSPNAVCCSDTLHCCPYGTVCNINAGTCVNETTFLTSITHSKVPSLVMKSRIKSVICPDAMAICGDNQTCCVTTDGSYGCCPFANAVCCSDRHRCCPYNTVCNITAGTCGHNTSSETYVSTPLQPRSSFHREKYVDCIDGQMCEDGQTCCLYHNDFYGCCRHRNGVCCSDGLNCCPFGTVCNIEERTCFHQSSAVASLLQLKVPNLRIESVMCPDSKTQCNDDQTCCSSIHGDYGCCPLNNAVCCSDRIHCCPHNTVCNITAGVCVMNERASMMSASRSEVFSFPRIKYEMCLDGHTVCQSDQTCCLSNGGIYGCCPSANAVCCSDGLHCCPPGTVCDITTGTCGHQSSLTSISQVKVSHLRVKSLICPDGKTQCDDDQTCCSSVNGLYGCCPFSNAVCCSDQLHCCPYNTLCNITTGTCGLRSTSAESISQTKVLNVGVQSVVCPDSQSLCDDGQTCCASNDGSFGCCPDPNAVCCEDRIHCCPQGTTCNLNPVSCGVTLFPMRKSRSSP